MDHWVYILFSSSLARYYIGESRDPQTRLEQHRTGHFKGAYTARATDWDLVLQLPCGPRQKALKVEAFLKQMRNRVFLERSINDVLYRKQLLMDRFDIRS